MSVAIKRSYILAGIIILTFWSLVGSIAYQRLATRTVTKAYCNDYGCTNFKNGTNWAIRNCTGSSSTDGSTYTCSQKGLTGSCGTTAYCCPGTGLLWTTDMTECSNSTNCCSCPTPTPTAVTSACNAPCMSNGNCKDGNICIFDQGYGWICRNPACYKTTSCDCTTVTPTSTPTPTPTPTPIEGQYYCGELCLSTSECQSDLQCVSVGNTRVCRNPSCADVDTCLCID